MVALHRELDQPHPEPAARRSEAALESPKTPAAAQVPDVPAHAQRDVHRHGPVEPCPRPMRHTRPRTARLAACPGPTATADGQRQRELFRSLHLIEDILFRSQGQGFSQLLFLDGRARTHSRASSIPPGVVAERGPRIARPLDRRPPSQANNESGASRAVGQKHESKDIAGEDFTSLRCAPFSVSSTQRAKSVSN